MDFLDFKTEVMENIKAYLPEEYQDYEVTTQEINKAGQHYEGLVIRANEATTITPILNLASAFEEYKSGVPINSIMMKLARTRINAKLPDNVGIKEIINDFNRAKEKIVPKLINRETNRAYLAGKPFTPVEDLAIVYAVRLKENEEGFGDAGITTDLLRYWGISLDTLHKVAMENLAKRPYLFTDMFSVMAGTRELNPKIEDINWEECPFPFFVLSNPQTTKGAIMALNADVMDRIVNHFGPVYIIPSSTDEVLVVPQKSSNRSAGELAEMVSEVNASTVAPEDQLSDNVYTWDTENKTLKML